MRRQQPLRRVRRGSELVEFALIFPIFMFLFIGVMEYSWFFYQRGVVVDAARVGCQAATQLHAEADPARSEDYATVASDTIRLELANKGGIDCDGLYSCLIELEDFSEPPNFPPRLVCRVEVDFISLTGYLGADPNNPSINGPGGQLHSTRYGTDSNLRLLPRSMRGQSSSIFEERD